MASGKYGAQNTHLIRGEPGEQASKAKQSKAKAKQSKASKQAHVKCLPPMSVTHGKHGKRQTKQANASKQNNNKQASKHSEGSFV